MEWNGHQIPVIQKIITDNKYKSYLEVGIQHGVTLFNVDVERRVGVDVAITRPLIYNQFEFTEAYKLLHDGLAPNSTLVIKSSDEYFDTATECFSMIFVDGFHSNDQAYRDIIHSLARLNDGGTIVVHDTIPPDAKAATPDVLQAEGAWCGDVWKAIVRLRCSRTDLEIFTVPIPVGFTVIRPTTEPQALLDKKYLDYTWEQFDKEKDVILNIKNG